MILSFFIDIYIIFIFQMEEQDIGRQLFEGKQQQSAQQQLYPAQYLKEAIRNSEYLDQYNHYMETTALQQSKQPNPIKAKLVTISTNQQQYHYQSKTISKNPQINIFDIYYCKYEYGINLINIKGNNPLLKQCQSKTGNYGKIYYFKFLNQTFAIKIFVKGDLHMSDLISKVLKQYFILKISQYYRCGPYIRNYFGFDLICYDDSIMFCMEKCQEIQTMTEQIIYNLKENLKAMHKHQIIHFDIKPANIMFSPTFMKPIFIDFGFSQIVKQKLGQMTLINFRGSPAFCSRQMNKLIGEQRFDFVDVYFNDMHSLRTSIHLMKQQLGVQNAELLKPNERRFVDEIILQDESIQDILAFILLKYRLLTNPTEGVVQLLKYNQCFLLRQYGNQIFAFIQKNHSFSFFEEIYSKVNKEFHTFIQPKLIQNYFKYYHRALSNWSIKQDQDQISNQETAQETAVSPAKQQKSPTSFEKYKQFLQISDVFKNPQYQQKSKFILIESLRFDRKNNAVEQKIKLSARFNLAFTLQSQPNLSSIKTTFQILFKYCLDKPRTEWKKTYIFVILTQLMMLDVRIQPYYEELISFLLQANSTFYDKVRCSIQLLKFRNLQHFKHISQFFDEKEVIHKLSQFAYSLLKQTLQQGVNNIDIQIKQLAIKIQDYIKTKQKNYFQNIFKLIQDFKNGKQSIFTNYLIQFFYLNELKDNNEIQINYQTLYEYFDFVKNFTLFKTEGFHYSLYYVYKILFGMKKFKQICIIFKKIIEQINCVQISSKFKFEICMFVYSDEKDVQKLNKFTLQLLRNTKFINYWIDNLDAQFRMLCFKIRQCQQTSQTFFHIGQNIEQLYNQLNHYLKSQKVTSLFQQIHRQTYMYQILLSLSTLSNFQTIVQQLVNELQNKTNDQSNQTSAYNNFFLNLYKEIYYFQQNQLHEQLLTIQKLYLFSKTHLHPNMAIKLMSKIVWRSAKLSKQWMTLKYSYRLYNLINISESFQKYFQNRKSKLIAITLYHFYKNKDFDEYYKFLISLAEFITRCLDEIYFSLWIENIQVLLSFHGQQLQLMRFESLRQRIKQNAYWNKRYIICYFAYSIQIEDNQQQKLKIFQQIVKWIDYLKGYAKDMILAKCFIEIASVYKQNKRKIKYLFIRWGYKYLKKKYIVSQLSKNIKKNNENHRNHIQYRYLRNKIKKGVQK